MSDTGEITVQWQLALKLLAENIVVVGSTVLLETAWVLMSQFGYSRRTVAGLLSGLTEVENLQFQEPDRVLISRGISCRHGFS